MLLLDVCETAAASEFAGAIVSLLAAVTMVAAGDGASVAGAPCVLAGSMPLASSGEANRAVSPSITRSALPIWKRRAGLSRPVTHPDSPKTVDERSLNVFA